MPVEKRERFRTDDDRKKTSGKTFWKQNVISNIIYRGNHHRLWNDVVQIQWEIDDSGGIRQRFLTVTARVSKSSVVTKSVRITITFDWIPFPKCLNISTQTIFGTIQNDNKITTVITMWLSRTLTVCGCAHDFHAIPSIRNEIRMLAFSNGSWITYLLLNLDYIGRDERLRSLLSSSVVATDTLFYNAQPVITCFLDDRPFGETRVPVAVTINNIKHDDDDVRFTRTKRARRYVFSPKPMKTNGKESTHLFFFFPRRRPLRCGSTISHTTRTD